MNFQELKIKLDPQLKAIARKLDGRFTAFNEEDLYQEELLHLWIYFNKGELFDKTDSYILQGCYFHLKNYIRKMRDKTHLVSIDTLVGEEDRSLEEILPLENPKHYIEDLENNLLFEHIQNNGFTKREKEVLSLCLEGLTTREIGKQLGISHVRVVKVKNNLRRKLEFLKE